MADGRARIRHGGAEVAVHAETTGRRQRIVDPAYYHGVAGAARPAGAQPAAAMPGSRGLSRIVLLDIGFPLFEKADVYLSVTSRRMQRGGIWINGEPGVNLTVSLELRRRASASAVFAWSVSPLSA